MLGASILNLGSAYLISLHCPPEFSISHYLCQFLQKCGAVRPVAVPELCNLVVVSDAPELFRSKDLIVLPKSRSIQVPFAMQMAWHDIFTSGPMWCSKNSRLDMTRLNIQRKYGIATKERSTVEKRPRKTKRLQESKKENRISLLLCLLLFSVFPMFLLLLGHCSLGGVVFSRCFKEFFNFIQCSPSWKRKNTEKTKRQKPNDA